MKLSNYCSFNFRPLVILAVTIMAGILCGAYLWNVSYVIWIAVGTLAVVCCVAMFKNKSVLALIAVGTLLGIISCSIFMTTLNKTTSYTNATVSCKVVEIEDYNDTDYTYAYWVDNITIDSDNLNKSGLLYTNTKVELFSTVTIIGNAEKFIPDILSSYDASSYQNGLRYSIYTTTYLYQSDPDPTNLESILYDVKETIILYLGADSGSLVLSILLGDKSYMSESLSSTLSITGLSHIMSISGLHVSFVIAIVYFLLKKFRLNNIFSLVITMIALIFYGYITDFPISLIRATTMYFIASLANICSFRYDMLNGIALTAILLLLCSPITLFNISFQLSFTAILGICLFYRSIYAFLNKFNKYDGKFLRFIFASISLSLSANILIFPVIIHYFGYFGSYFLLANLLIVSTVSLLFALLWLFIAIMLIAPILTPLIIFTRYIAQFIVNLSNIIANLPLASLSFQSMGILSLVYIPTLCLLSEVNGAIRMYKMRLGFCVLCISTIISLII